MTVSLWFVCKMEEDGRSGHRENRGVQEAAEHRAEGERSKKLGKEGE